MYHGFVSERQDFGAPDLSHSPQSQMLVPTRQPHHHEGSVKNTRWDVYDTESKMRCLVCIISLKCPRRQCWWHVYVSMLSCIRWTGHLAGSYLSWSDRFEGIFSAGTITGQDPLSGCRVTHPLLKRSCKLQCSRFRASHLALLESQQNQKGRSSTQ